MTISTATQSLEFKNGEILNFRYEGTGEPVAVMFIRMSASGKKAYIRHKDIRGDYSNWSHQAYVSPKNLERP